MPWEIISTLVHELVYQYNGNKALHVIEQAPTVPFQFL